MIKNKTVEGSSGELESPNYPAPYENDLNYWVHVIGPANTRLVFVFETIDLEVQKDCLYDFVEVSLSFFLLFDNKQPWYFEKIVEVVISKVIRFSFKIMRFDSETQKSLVRITRVGVKPFFMIV